MNNATTTTFEAGKTYTMRWICDADATTEITIERRTAKSVWIRDLHTREIVRKSITVWDNVETIMPTGSYSMAPSLQADNVAA